MKKKTKNKLFIGLCILTFCFVLFELNFFKIESDYFWHIKAGEYMIHNGLLKKDVFSWIVDSKYWMSHEWLFEIFIYGLKSLFGKYHVIIYAFITLAVFYFTLLLTNKDKYIKNIPFTLVWYLFLFLLLIVCIQARPHMISFSLLAITIYVLYDLYNDSESKKIYILPFITIFWANVHGGSSNLPYLFCLLFIIGGSFSFKRKKIEAKRLEKKQIIKYTVIMFICMACVCINLHGFKMFTYPYLNMKDTIMLNNISEWRSTSLNEGYHYVYFLFLVFIILTMLFSDNKIELMDLLLLGIASFFGLKSIRFWIYTYIIMSYVIFNYIKERKADKGTYESLLVMGFLFLSIFMFNFKNILDVKYNVYLDKEVIDKVKEENPKRLFNMYNYGGELVYNDIKVFVDGRADLYSKYNYKDYLDISELNNDYVKLIDKYDFDYFLVNKNYPIRTYLKYNDSYEKIYANKKVELYKYK